jgi:predicted flavoprotein YhiN
VIGAALPVSCAQSKLGSAAQSWWWSNAPHAPVKRSNLGGGRCNFTSIDRCPDNFLSSNPHFWKFALARFTPYHFLELVEDLKPPVNFKASVLGV